MRNPPASPARLPHIEYDGVACLVAGATLMELPVDIRHTAFVIEEAVELVKAELAGANRDDFLEEVSSYWTRDQRPSDSIWYLAVNAGRTGPARALQLKGVVVVSESESAASAWAKNALPGTPKGGARDAVVAQLQRPLYPEAFPSDTGELVSLLSEAAGDARNLVLDALAKGKQLPLILSFEHKGRLHLVGAHVSVSARIGHGHGSKPLHHGFRKGHVPRDVLAQRLSEARFPVVRTT